MLRRFARRVQGGIRRLARRSRPVTWLIDARERWRAACGAACGIWVVAWGGPWLASALARWLPVDAWLIAPLGASAVLVFAVPASPLAQPWAVVGGNTLSALVGIACAQWLPEPALAAAAAVSLAIASMFLARCLHPPGGATALLAVVSQVEAWRFALSPVLLCSLLLVLAGMAYNSLTGRRYPHRQHGNGSSMAAPAALPAQDSLRFTSADLDAALARYNQVLDVSRDDLEALLHHAETAAYRRSVGGLSCADVMSQAPQAVGADMPVRQAHALMRTGQAKALPVVDGGGRVIGIVTAADMLAQCLPAPGKNAWLGGWLSRPRAAVHVGDIMNRDVATARAGQALFDLVRLFSDGAPHSVPIVDDARRLVGVVTQSDVLRALYRAVRI